MNKPNTLSYQIIYGNVVHWVTVIVCVISTFALVFILAKPENNVLHPNRIFNSIFSGAAPEEVWANADGGFPGGHFYLRNFSTGDGLAQFSITLGCSVTLWALLPVFFILIRKKDYLYTGICAFVFLLIAFSMSGLI
ncbi:MAG: hypothetical protein WC959_10185 [Kiritimatiellales bacterium]